jgi:glycosyltransferase involved in cell wall biosynthesis
LPFFSIITVNLNNKDGLKKTIESVFEQSFKDYEYRVIDGESNDGSVEVIKQYDHYLSDWVSEPDKGIYNAMNKGIKRSNGLYLLFLNSGDVLAGNDVLQKVFEEAEEKDIIYGHYKMNENLYKSPTQLSFSNFWHRSICHQSVFFSKKLFDQYGLYDDSLKIAADWFFLVYVLFKKDSSYKCIDLPISIIEPGGVSNSIETYKNVTSAERNYIYKTYFPGFYQDYQELAQLRLTISSRLVKMAIFLSKSFQKVKRLIT